MKKYRFVLFLLVSMVSAGCQRTPPGKGLPVAREVIVQVALDSIRAKIPKSGFPAASKTPNQYMTDFFGILRLNARLQPRDVLGALVPAHARVASADSVLRLEFKAGGTADFYFNAGLRLDRQQPMRGLNFVVLPHALTSADASPHVDKLWALLASAGLLGRFLEPNPFYTQEQRAHAAAQMGAQAIGSAESEGFDGFARQANAVYLVPDRVHGEVKRYDEFVALVKRPEVDWIALEMISVDLNHALRRYHAAAAGSAGFIQARSAILEYYRGAWNDRFGALEVPDSNHYFKLIELARELRKPVYALDTNLEYVFFRYGEFPLGATARNVIWAEQLPRSGRGLVFGGSGHMARMPGNVQYFVKQLRPELRIYNHDAPRE